MNIGDQIRYRANPGRGRPAVGEVVGFLGKNLRIKNLRNGKIVIAGTARITGDYVFKPYNKKVNVAWMNFLSTLD